MRRSERQIKKPAVIAELLTRTEVGRLGTIGKDGFPHIKPINYVFDQDKIFFHSALEGEKMDEIRANAHVCFEIDKALGYYPAQKYACSASYQYQSVIIKGIAKIIEDATEKMQIFLK
jgi:nitroimidazol reductase NimA-like FMN-containing flavoprotein (pyridoxamine 5'-phosphate oxidase superfamily)